MVLHELGYPAIAPQSENANISEPVISSLQLTFNRVVVFYDNDETG
jgi:hypothetical protein